MARHRIAMARALGLGDTEVLAVAHLLQHGELTQTRLAELLSLSSGGAAALVQRLEDRGHVRRRGDDQDKRVRFVSLTESTLQRIAQFSRPLRDDIAELLSRYGDDEAAVKAFLDSLATITERHTEQACETVRRPSVSPARVSPGLWG